MKGLSPDTEKVFNSIKRFDRYAVMLLCRCAVEPLRLLPFKQYFANSFNMFN
jgi:hypothetical protein